MDNGRLHAMRLEVGVLSMALALSALAADGRVPIGTVPYTIASQGSYYLTADLTYAANAAAITISASNVSLDLNGHSITMQSTGLNASGIASNGYTNIRVFDGMLKGGSSLLYILNASAGLISVDGLTISGFGGFGILISGSGSQPGIQVTNNRISALGGPTSNPTGIGVFTVSGGAISNNQIIGNGTTGGDGIFINPAADLLIADNSVTNWYLGITAQPGTAIKIVRNNASQNIYGMYFTSSSGIDVDDNLMIGNTSYGLYFSTVTNSFYRNNSAQGNGTNYSIPGTGVTNAGGNY